MGRYDHYPKSDDFSYRLLQGVLILSSVFCTAVLILIVINFAQADVADPLTNKQYQSIMALARANPDNQAIIQQAKDMDHLIRRAFFSNQTFRRTGAWMLFFGLIIFLASYKAIEKFKKRSPFPGMDPSRDEIQDTKQGRTATTIVTSLISGLGVFLIFSNEQIFNEDKINTLHTIKEEREKASKPPPSLEEMRSNWPSFRGPLGWGISYTDNIPDHWDTKTGKNIRWKTEINAPGFNSPIVWNEAIYLSGAGGADNEQGEFIFSFSRDKGKLNWKYKVEGISGSPAELPEVTQDTGHAASTLVTDGRYIAGIFSTGNLICLNTKGEKVWGKNLGVPENHYGHSSSLYLFENALYVQFDRGQQGEVLCFDIRDGKKLWSKARKVAISWSSPIIAEVENKYQLILLADPNASAYDLKTGEELWSLEAIYGEIGPSPAYENGMVYMANEYARLAAIDITSGQEVWSGEDHLPSISSPLAKNGLLILATAFGSVACLDGQSGEVLWQEDFDEGFHSSPVYANDRVYLTDIKGTTFIFPLSKQYESSGKGLVYEEASTTPAIADGRIYIRTKTRLICIGAL